MEISLIVMFHFSIFLEYLSPCFCFKLSDNSMTKLSRHYYVLSKPNFSYEIMNKFSNDFGIKIILNCNQQTVKFCCVQRTLHLLL